MGLVCLEGGDDNDMHAERKAHRGHRKATSLGEKLRREASLGRSQEVPALSALILDL